MKITIDVSPAVHQRAGLGRYANELVNALCHLQEPAITLQAFYAEASHANPQGMIATLPPFQSRLGYKPWRLLAMCSHFTRRPLDHFYGQPQLVHATDHLLPHLRARTVFTLHDLIFEIFPHHHKRYNHAFLKLMMPRFLRAADHIICVSECTKRDAERLYGIEPSKMTVIYEAAEAHYRPLTDFSSLERVRQHYQLPESFILHVGTIEPRKNLGLLLEAFKALKTEFPALKLVLVGKKGWLYQPFFEQLRKSGLESEVILPGYVTEADLPAIYQLAELFVFPSVYEGFGLPPLEALACGCAVICSDSSSLPEVVGDAALLISPTQPENLTTAIRRLLTDSALRHTLKAHAPEQAARFSWASAARKTFAVYQLKIKN